MHRIREPLAVARLVLGLGPVGVERQAVAQRVEIVGLMPLVIGDVVRRGGIRAVPDLAQLVQTIVLVQLVGRAAVVGPLHEAAVCRCHRSRNDSPPGSS